MQLFALRYEADLERFEWRKLVRGTGRQFDFEKINMARVKPMHFHGHIRQGYRRYVSLDFAFQYCSETQSNHSLCFYISVSVCLSVSLSLSLSLSFCLSLSLCVFLSLYLCLCLSVCLSVCVCLFVSVCLSLSLCLSLSVCLPICLSLSLPVDWA